MTREKSIGVLVIRGPSLILKKSQFLNCYYGYTPLLEVNQALNAWSCRQARHTSHCSASKLEPKNTSSVHISIRWSNLALPNVYGHIMLKTPVLV